MCDRTCENMPAHAKDRQRGKTRDILHQHSSSNTTINKSERKDGNKAGKRLSPPPTNTAAVTRHQKEKKKKRKEKKRKKGKEGKSKPTPPSTARER